MPKELHFTFPLKNGMHARPASLFQDLANAYRARITFVNRQTGVTANGKSTLSLVGTITREGDPCSLLIEGEDEQAAFAGMEKFLNEEFPACDDDLVVPEVMAGAPRPLPRALRHEHMQFESGISVSRGVARAPAALVSSRSLEPPLGGWPKGTDDGEVARLAKALREVQGNLQAQTASAPQGVEQAVLKAYLSIVADPDYRTRVEETLRVRHCSVGEALMETAHHYTEILARSGSVYLQERVLDVRDVTSQLVTAVYGPAAGEREIVLGGECVCVAENLAPSQFISLDKRLVKGLVLAHSGVTSHTVILARAFGIPCITGVPDAHRKIAAGEDVIVDADRGLVIHTPSDRVARFYVRATEKAGRMKAKLRRFAALPGISADGRRLEVAANASSCEEVEAAFGGGAEGIGLFRTEILFMDRTEPPEEEEQFRLYSQVAKSAGDRSAIIRTLDIGGDKPIPYLNLPSEENPFLGYRAVRLYDEFPQIINAQLRAILRASAFGKLKIMFPMICSLQEVRSLKARLRQLTGELDAEGLSCDHRIPIGIMVEIPSVAFIIDQLSQEVDFFSIGSNDLTQYFLAVDRSNPKVSSLYTSFHPSFLRLLKHIVDEVHRHGKWVGLCGELGGNPLAAPLFLGCGIDEVSLAIPLIPAVKEVVHSCRTPMCEELLKSVTQMERPEDVEAALKAFALSLKGGSLISEELVQLSSQAGTKDEAIRELVDLLHLAGRVDDPDLVEEAVWAREETYATGMGFGVAIPHCKSPHVGASSIAVLKLEAPVMWKMPDEDPVEFVILIAISASAKGDEHLRIIAGLARKLMHEEFRRQLIDAEEPGTVASLLTRQLAAV